MQKYHEPPNSTAQIDRRNTIITALVAIAIVSAAALLTGFDPLVGIAWAFALISIVVLAGATLWMLKNPEIYPRSASLPLCAKSQMVGSLLMSAGAVLLDRAQVFSLSPALFGLLQAALFALTTIRLLAVLSANRHISNIEARVGQKCETLRALRLDLERVTSRAQNAQLADALGKLTEEVRFSDPVSNPALIDVEEALQQTIRTLEQAVLQEDSAQAQALIKNASLLLNERNQKCLASKR